MGLHDSYATIVAVENLLAADMIVTATREYMTGHAGTGSLFVRNFRAR